MPAAEGSWGDYPFLFAELAVPWKRAAVSQGDPCPKVAAGPSRGQAMGTPQARYGCGIGWWCWRDCPAERLGKDSSLPWVVILVSLGC